MPGHNLPLTIDICAILLFCCLFTVKIALKKIIKQVFTGNSKVSSAKDVVKFLWEIHPRLTMNCVLISCCYCNWETRHFADDFLHVISLAVIQCVFIDGKSATVTVKMESALVILLFLLELQCSLVITWWFECTDRNGIIIGLYKMMMLDLG